MSMTKLYDEIVVKENWFWTEIVGTSASPKDLVPRVPNFNMYQSIPSLTIPRATPGDSHVLIARRSRVFAQLSLSGGQGFELEKFLTALKENAGTFRFVSKRSGAV